MEPITVGAIAVVALIALRATKKKDRGPKVYQVHYEDLRTKEQHVTMRAGDSLEVVLPGIREQWGIQALCPAEGCALALPDMVDIGVSAAQGVVAYTFVAMPQTVPWMLRLQFTLLGKAEGREIIVSYEV